MRVGDQDIRRIQQMGDKNWYVDPVTGEGVIDAIRENPPRPDRDIHVYAPNEKLEEFRNLRRYLFAEDSVSREDLRQILKDKGIKNPGQLISYYKRRGWIEENRFGAIMLPAQGFRPGPTAKTKRMLDYPNVAAVVFNSRSIKKRDMAYFSRNSSWRMTSIGNNIIFYNKRRADYWKDYYGLFQLHDQSVASDSYKPIVFSQYLSKWSPVLAYSDTEGNGLLLKNLRLDLDEGKREVETLKFGRYLGAGVPKDARVVGSLGEFYVIEKLVPRHVLWEEADWNLRKKALEDSPGQAGRAVVFHEAVNMSDRHGGNYMVTRRGAKHDITDIDFGFENFQKSAFYNLPYISAERKPEYTDVDRLIKYEQARAKTINRIAKLVHTGQHKAKFTKPETLDQMAELRKRGRQDDIAKIRSR